MLTVTFFSIFMHIADVLSRHARFPNHFFLPAQPCISILINPASQSSPSILITPTLQLSSPPHSSILITPTHQLSSLPLFNSHHPRSSILITLTHQPTSTSKQALSPYLKIPLNQTENFSIPKFTNFNHFSPLIQAHPTFSPKNSQPPKNQPIPSKTPHLLALLIQRPLYFNFLHSKTEFYTAICKLNASFHPGNRNS